MSRNRLVPPGGADTARHTGERLLLFVSGSAMVLLAIQLARLIAEAAGWCTGCNVGSDGDILVATTVGGGAAAWGGDDEPFFSFRFNGWVDGLFGDERPTPGVEGLDQPLPADPAFDQPADVEAIRGSFFYEEVTDDDSALNQLKHSVHRLLGTERGAPTGDQPPGDQPPGDPPSSTTDAPPTAPAGDRR